MFMKTIFILMSLAFFSFFSRASLSQIPGAMLQGVSQANSDKLNSQEQAKENNSKSELALDLTGLKNPRETMRTFLEAMELIKKREGDTQAHFNQAVKTLNLSFIDEGQRFRVGRMVAEKLINSLDRISKIELGAIPASSEGSKWYFRKQTLKLGNENIEAEIAIEKNADGAWRFSAETVATISILSNSLTHLPVVSGVLEYRNWRTTFKSYLPEWSSEYFLFFSKAQWLGFIVIFILALLSMSLVRFMTTIYIHDLVKKESLKFDEKDHYKSTMPFGLLSFSLLCMGGIRILELDHQSYDFLVRVFYILIAISSVWSALKIVDLISMHFAKIAKDTSNKFDDVLVPMLSKTSKVLVVSFGTILVAHSLTFDIGSILAGLGIGGVAVALAAKDTISNLFGSVTVIMDRPFLIGDYVLLDKGLEGVVEEVGFRSTRIRTPHQSLVSLPNNVLANMAIDNFGMRESRRFRIQLQVEMDTPIAKLEEFCERLRYLCRIHQYIDPSNAQVFIYDVTDKAINVLVNVYFKTTDGTIELSERHKLILEILKTAKELDVKLFSPTPSPSPFFDKDSRPQNI